MTSNYDVSTNLEIFYFCIFDDYEANIASISTNFFCFHMSLICFFYFLTTGMFPTISFEIMAFRPKKIAKFLI